MIITETMLRSLIRESLLLEGPRDPGIFKAIFMAGCPGSGKGTVIRAIFGTDSGTTYQGLKIVNPDQLYEYLLSASDMALAAPDLPDDDPDLSAYRSAAGKMQYRAGMKTTGGSKGISPGHVGLDPGSHGYKPAKKERGRTQLETYIDGRLGLIIDGTAANLEKIKREKLILEDLGYDTMMIAVNVPVDVALERNRARGLEGKRSIDDRAVQRTCDKLVENIPAYRDLFGTSYIEIDNTLPTSQTVTTDVTRSIDRFISSPLSQVGQQWVSDALSPAPSPEEEPEELTPDEADQLSALVGDAVADALDDEESDDNPDAEK